MPGIEFLNVNQPPKPPIEKTPKQINETYKIERNENPNTIKIDANENALELFGINEMELNKLSELFGDEWPGKQSELLAIDDEETRKGMVRELLEKD